ncbi:hypothetical protein IJT17_05775 [bacterium]|nr:hypothetical protein [bacterium]
MKYLYYIWCAVMLVSLVGCNLFGIYPTSTDTIPKAPSVKTIRNNPAAFRSFTSSGFTGK